MISQIKSVKSDEIGGGGGGGGGGRPLILLRIYRSTHN